MTKESVDLYEIQPKNEDSRVEPPPPVDASVASLGSENVRVTSQPTTKCPIETQYESCNLVCIIRRSRGA